MSGTLAAAFVFIQSAFVFMPTTQTVGLTKGPAALTGDPAERLNNAWNRARFTSEIGIKRTYQSDRWTSAFRGKPEVGVGQIDFRF